VLYRAQFGYVPTLLTKLILTFKSLIEANILACLAPPSILINDGGAVKTEVFALVSFVKLSLNICECNQLRSGKLTHFSPVID
jgi:hypothetical protein